MTNPVSMRRLAAGLVAACFGLAAALAGAQEAGSRPTREFVQATESADQYEILAAAAALIQSRNPQVQAFAMRMRQDHQQSAQSLIDAATRSGLKPPEMALGADQAQWLGALQGLRGTEFDTLYLKQQVLAHRSALTVQQIYAASGDDSNLRQWATSAATLTASHAEMAGQVSAKVGSP